METVPSEIVTFSTFRFASSATLLADHRQTVGVGVERLTDQLIDVAVIVGGVEVIASGSDRSLNGSHLTLVIREASTTLTLPNLGGSGAQDLVDGGHDDLGRPVDSLSDGTRRVAELTGDLSRG
jgi:hypothetical protein